MRDEKYFAVFIVLILLASIGSIFASDDVLVTLSSNIVVEGEAVEMTCTTKLYRRILMIEYLDENDIPLVYVRDGSRVTFSKKVTTGIEADGFVSINSKNNHLNMTLTSPKISDSGKYSCIVFYLDEMGAMMNDKHTVTLTVKEAPTTEAPTTKAPTTKALTTEVPKFMTTVPSSPEKSYPPESILNSLLDRLVQVELCGQFQPYWIIGMTNEEMKEVMTAVSDNKVQTQPGINAPIDINALADRMAKLETILYTNALMSNGSSCKSGGSPKSTTKTPTKIDKDLMDKIEKLERQNQEMSKELEKLSKDKAKSDNSQTQATQVILKKVNKLEKEGTKQSQQLAALTVKSSSMTAFHATFNEVNRQVKRGMIMTFPDVLAQQGQGFDPNTGVFTVPKDGIYGFHLSMDNLGTGICKVVLKADDRYFSLLSSGSKNDLGQTSVSSVVDLKAGEKVRAVVIDVQGQVYLRGWSYSTFTGYLLWSS